MKNDERQIAGAVMALVDGTCWKFSGCCGQYLFEQRRIETPWLVVVRLSFAGIILVLAGFKLHGRGNLRVFRKKRGTIRLLTFAIFGIAFCQFTYFIAIQASDVGTAIVLQYLSSILILTVACIRELRLPKEPELAVIGSSLSDTFVTGTHRDVCPFHIMGETPFWGFLTAVGSMIHTTIPGGLTLKHDIYQVLGFGTFFGGIAMGAVVQPWNYEVVWDTSTLGALAGMVVTGAAVAFGLYLQDVSMTGPLKGSATGGVEPVSAVAMSVFWLGTQLTLPDFLGFALILGVVFVLTFAHR